MCVGNEFSIIIIIAIIIIIIIINFAIIIINIIVIISNIVVRSHKHAVTSEILFIDTNCHVP
jgi:hypothetical protein